MSVAKLYDIYKNYCVFEPIGIADKGTTHSYIEIYGQELKNRYKDRVNLLEIGVAEGHSLKMWKEYFSEESNIIGVDIEPHRLRFKDITVLIGDVVTNKSIIHILQNLKFDIIIDDGSHNLEDQLSAFHNLKKCLTTNGIYFIEDIKNIDNQDVYNSFDKLDFIIHDRRKIKNCPDDVIAIYKKTK